MIRRLFNCKPVDNHLTQSLKKKYVEYVQSCKMMSRLFFCQLWTMQDMNQVFVNFERKIRQMT